MPYGFEGLQKNLYNMQPICNPLNLASNLGFIYFPRHCCTNSQQNVMNIFVNHVVNPTTSEDEFHALVEYIEHKLLERITRSLKPNCERNMKRGLLNMWTTKCITLMSLLLQESSKESGGGTPTL
jgi:hypothetical protein